MRSIEVRARALRTRFYHNQKLEHLNSTIRNCFHCDGKETLQLIFYDRRNKTGVVKCSQCGLRCRFDGKQILQVVETGEVAPALGIPDVWMHVFDRYNLAIAQQKPQPLKHN